MVILLHEKTEGVINRQRDIILLGARVEDSGGRPIREHCSGLHSTSVLRTKLAESTALYRYTSVYGRRARIANITAPKISQDASKPKILDFSSLTISFCLIYKHRHSTQTQ